MMLTPSLSSPTRFQSVLKPDWNVEPANRGFSSNSVPPTLKPTNNKKKKDIEAGFTDSPPAHKSRRRVGVCAERHPEAPAIGYITERRHGRTQEQLAHSSTGRSRTTGQLTLGIGIRKRRNGLVIFDGDLYRINLDLHPDAIERLHRHWHDLNTDYSLPKKILRKMACHFGKTTIIFDATTEQVDEWREFLNEILTDSASYVDIRSRPPSQLHSVSATVLGRI
jgi:hypothetical protein